LRIVGGSARGRRLAAPPDLSIRPTADKVREAVFDLLGPGAPGTRVLDLFSGTGALGLEAVSRGAARAVLVERDHRALALIAENARRCGFEDRVEVVRADALRHLASAPPAGGYDLVLLDPPYRQGLAAEALALLVRPGWLAPGARVVVETEAGLELPPPPPLALDRSRRYGDTAVHLLEGPEPPGPMG